VRLALERMTRAFHPGAPIATFHCAAPARCGVFVDERRIVVDDEGGRLPTGVFIATFHRASLARCGRSPMSGASWPARAEARRMRTRNAHPPAFLHVASTDMQRIAYRPTVPDLPTPGGGGWTEALSLATGS
jgi:hypothetical protein